VSQLLDDVSSEELAKIMEAYEAVSHNRKLNVVGLSEIVTEFVDIFSSYADPLLTLVPLRSMDEYTFTHSLNVCLLNIGQATALGIDGPLLHDIGLSAMLHDIGKLFLPEEVLNKSGRLDSEEWELLKEHPVKGAEYLVKTPGVPRMAVANAYEHHMRFDQRGYPTVSNDWQQSLSSQITAISDTYDALRTHRPYRTPMDVDEVLVNISNLAGTQLHPLLVENFLRLMKRVHPDH
jgi:HD-GYP domain-containing protein (c-di-GMP phosphodiesterase class II)